MELKSNEYSVALICDFGNGLAQRILDVYRFFVEPPNIIFATRKTEPFSTDPRLSIHVENIPIPMVGLEIGGVVNVFSAMSCAVAYLLYSVILFLRIRRKSRVKIVHTHFIFPEGLFGLLLAHLLRVPLIVTVQGQDVNILMRKNAFLRFASLLVLRGSYVAIAVSKPLEIALRHFGISNIVCLPNSVDTDSIRPAANSGNETSILFVGSMTKRKQPLVLLSAFQKVVERIPEATLLMCGDGPLKERVLEEIDKMSLRNRVKLLRHVNEETLNELRSRTGIFVLPSRSEGASLALLEAMAAGQAVIASRNRSNETILEDGKNGLLFDMDSSKELAEQILVAMTDKRLRREISESARRLCEAQFSNSVVAKHLENIYLKAINSG